MNEPTSTNHSTTHNNSIQEAIAWSAQSGPTTRGADGMVDGMVDGMNKD